MRHAVKTVVGAVGNDGSNQIIGVKLLSGLHLPDVIEGTKKFSLLVYKLHDVSNVDLIQLFEERVVE